MKLIEMKRILILVLGLLTVASCQNNDKEKPCDCDELVEEGNQWIDINGDPFEGM